MTDIPADFDTARIESETLRERIERNRVAYYEGGSLVSDAEYDADIHRLEAIERCRLAVQANGALPLVLEGLMVELRDPLVAVR